MTDIMIPRIRQLALAEIEKRKRMVAQKDDAEKDLLAFTRMIWPILEPAKEFKEGWIIDLQTDVFMAVAAGDLTRVCLNVPPGSMKSTLLNVCLPAWLWGPRNQPWMRFLSISYSDRVPTRDNLRFAEVLKHPVYRSCWGDRFLVTRDGAEWVGNSKTGWKAVTSVSGSTTGLRADILLLDDLNNPQNVESDVVRDATNRFVREVMPSRVNDPVKSAIINIQQRTHENDASGTLMTYAQGYTYVCVPAEFDPLRICEFTLRPEREVVDEESGEVIEVIPEDVWVDPRSLDQNGRTLRGLYRKPNGNLDLRIGSPMAQAEGETFWPERFPQSWIASEKSGNMTVYAWDSQFNQIPGVRGGAIIHREWWNLWRGSDYPDLGTVVVSVDTAIEEGEKNDYNACTVWGAFAGSEGEPLFLLLDAWRDRMPLAKLVEKVAATCRQRRADYLLIEHKTRGKDVHDEIIRLYQSQNWQTVLVKPEGDKVSRLRAVSHLFSGDVRKDPVTGMDVWGDVRKDPVTGLDVSSGGVIYTPDRQFAEDVIAEVSAFPYSSHDDWVDTVSQALGWLRKNGVVLRRAEFDEQELERNKFRRNPGVPYMIRSSN